MNYIYQNSRTEAGEYDRSALEQLLGELEEGDCLAVAQLSCAADSAAALLELLEDMQRRGIRFRSVAEGLDTGTPAGTQAIALLKAMLQLDAGQKPQEDAPQKGRKPIEIDEEMFDRILERWKNGEITARQAMAELDLKPNTFYRRVKEREGKSSTDSLLDAARKLGKDIVNTVTEGGKELQQAAGKLAAECDLSSLSDAARKNITAAGKVISSRMDSLSRDFQEAMQRCEKKPEESAEKAEGAQAPEAQPEEAVQPAPPVPEAPEVPEASEMPEVPEASEMPEAPEVPEVPEAPEAPLTEPETPDAPQEPEYL